MTSRNSSAILERWVVGLAGILLKISKHFMFMKDTGRDIQPKTGRDGAKVPNFGFIIFDSQEAVEKALKAKVRFNKHTSSFCPIVRFILFLLFFQPIMLFGNHRLNVEEKKNRNPREGQEGRQFNNDGRPPLGRGQS